MWHKNHCETEGTKQGGKENRYVESDNITGETEKNKKICQLFSELTFDTGNGIGNWHVCRRKQSQSEGRNSICRIPGSFRKQHSRGAGIKGIYAYAYDDAAEAEAAEPVKLEKAEGQQEIWQLA